jgi:hypothetical protein
MVAVPIPSPSPPAPPPPFQHCLHKPLIPAIEKQTENLRSASSYQKLQINLPKFQAFESAFKRISMPRFPQPHSPNIT